MGSFIRNTFIVSLFYILLTGCEGKFETNVDLQAVTLLIPENNSQCLGTELGSGLISVQLDWEDVDGMNSFLLEYEDVVTGTQFTELTEASSTILDLEPGTLYRWKVTVTDGFGNSKTSEEFTFYTEGLSEANHVPFPPNLGVIDNGDNTVDLSWQSSDLDDDISHYKVFFSPNDPPDEVISGTDQTSTTIGVEPNMEYFFKVIVYDENGNFSSNGISLEL
ncbi:fibronectin type III domain-containing protein [Flagellimonas crocea]|uniref:fibronectin type III domain-containing protein n=1 Tax=Flagellimonas crocea TaxID=3067311 RepID=UPI00296E6C73|nr:fibronectin type III domain-containing protein [Muricauda sp. DH64]